MLTHIHTSAVFNTLTCATAKALRLYSVSDGSSGWVEHIAGRGVTPWVSGAVRAYEYMYMYVFVRPRSACGNQRNQTVVWFSISGMRSTRTYM